MIELHVDNSAAMWGSRAETAVRDGGVLLAEHSAGARAIVLGPEARADRVRALAPRRALIVEDAFGVLEPRPVTRRMPIMVRRPGRVVTTPSRVRVSELADPAELAVAERVMVDGFPLPAYQPWSPGRALPPDVVLGKPGWRVWLGCHEGEPAAAAHTYDDGTAVGVYWLATLPEQRSRGAGRAVLSTAIAAYPDRPFTLIATEAGRPLYESVGFETAGFSTWHTREPMR